MKRTFLAVALAATAASFVTRSAKADGFDLDAGVGYSRLRIAGSGAKDLDKADGEAIHLGFTFGLPPTPPSEPEFGLRLGFDLNTSGFRDDFHAINDNGDLEHRYNQFTMIAPEFRVGLYVPIDHFFIQPSIGVGVAVADFSTGHVHHYYDDYYNDDDNDYYHDDKDRVRANVVVEPKLQAGFAFGRIAFGLEGSYLYTHLNFGDDIGGNIGEWYGGGFFRFRF